ncbi:AAA domain-containing protein, partial [bacterium]
GLGHLAKDTAAEAGEELFDAQLRQGLDGRHGALSADQIREITLVSGFGGAQMGALGHGFKLFQQRAESAPARNETAKIAEDSAAPAPSEAAGKSLSSMPWRNLLLSPMWMFLGAGGAGGLPPGRGGQSAPDSVDPAENEAFAKRLAAAHARLEPIFAKAGQPLTLRDLLLAGKVTAEMSLKLKALSMEESLRIVYAYRLADAEKSEAIQEDIRKLLDQKLFGSSDVDTVLREKIRLLLNKPEVTGLRGVYEALAELEGERLFSWIPRVLRYLSREELDEVLDQIAGTSSEEAVWILNSKNPAGGPRFKTLYLKAAREGVPGELDIFAGREWDLGRCLRDWGLVDEEVIQEFREGVFHDQELNRSHHIWALAGLGVWNGLWDEDLRDYLLEYLDGEASYVENIDEAAHFTLKIMAFRDKAVADHLGYSGPVEAYWHSWESGDAGQRFAALEIYKQLDLNEKKMVRSQWISRLESRDEEGRQKAVTALRELGESSPELRLAFSERLEDESDEVRFAVAMALVSLGLVDEAIKRKVEQVLAQGSGDQDIQVKVNCAAALRKLGDEESKASLLDWLKHGEAFFRESTAKALGKWGLAEEEFQPALQENLKDTSLSVRRAAELALDQLFPEWGKEFSKKLSAVPKILFEELSRIPAQATQENEQGVKSLEVGLPQWTDIGSSDSSRWEALIPERQKLFMSRSTTRALQGLVAGILTHTPLYLIGETGTGKNAILRHLANVTGTPLLRINFNRETDHSQLYGHFEIERDEQGQRRVVLRDGKMIQAMKHGAWVLWDEANLASEAFLVAQNDLIQQIQTGKVTVRQGGKPVTIEVHPHFRLFATGNPEGYVGRKATERSFGNRWLKIFVQPMPVEEQQAFLATEYMDLSPESAESIPAILHALKIVLGGERVTIRTLKRVAARIQELEAGDQSLSLWKRLPEGRAAFTQTGMRAYVRALEAEVLDGLNPEDYENAVQVLVQALPRGAYELKNFVSQGLSREEFEDKVGEYAGLLDRDGREGRRDKEQEENPEDPEALQAETRDWGEFVPVPTFLKYAAKALDSLIRGDHLLLEGPPATSKSSFMRLIGRLAGQEVIEATGSADHSTAEMIGMPALDEQGNLVFQEGYFLKALKEGAILVLNEANLIPAEVLERLNSVFDDDRMIVVSENGHEAPVQAHPNFRLVLTQNPAGMNGGRKRHSPALENKFRKIFICDLFLPEELSEILRHQFPDLKAAAPAMAELHAEIATVMYQENHILTLRDLKHWGIISSALQAHGAVAPDESLILGAKWVFAGRAGDRNAEGRLSTALQVFREKIDKTSSSRSEADTVGLLRRKIEDLRNNLDITSEVELWRKIIPENEGLLEYFEKVVPCLKSKEDVLAVWNLLLPLLKWHGRRENYQDFWEVACLPLLNALRSVSERFNLGAGVRGPLLELLEWHISGEGPLSDISFLWILRSLKSLNLVDPSVRAAIDRYGYVYRLIAVHVLDIWDKDLEGDFKEDLLRGRVEPDFYGNPSQHICFLAFVLWKRGMSLEEIRPRLPSLEQVAEGFGTEYPFSDESSLSTSCLLDALDRMGAESDKLEIISSLWERIPREVGKIRENCFRQIAEWIAGHHIRSPELERRLRPTVDEAAWLNFKYQVEKYIMSYTQLQQTDGSLGLDFHPNFFAFIEGTWSPEEEVTEMAPGDNRLAEEFSLLQRILAEKLGKTSSAITLEKALELSGLEGTLQAWPRTALDSSLGQHIPAPEKLFLGNSSSEALHGLIGGILASLPVYLLGETGTGKNAMLRYLAHQTGTPLLRINFNRETDASQLYGHFEIERDAQGIRRVVLRDGKMIQAMRHGAWVLWDEANLASEAFLVAQNDLIQQIQSGKVTVRQGGKLVTIEVHPHFRLFAAGNPEGYAGRKATERSFGNRWLKIFVKPMPVEEQQAYLATEYKNLSPRSAEAIPAVLHALRIALGGERVTLRTLK